MPETKTMRRENCPLCGEFVYFTSAGGNVLIAVCSGADSKLHGRLTMLLDESECKTTESQETDATSKGSETGEKPN